MTSIDLPAQLATSIRARWPTQASAWIRGVIPQLRRLCTRYGGEPAELMPARFGLVVAVSTPCGPLIMKSTPDPAGAVQAAFARRFADLGMAPKVHEVATTVAGTWTVMDRVVPGNTLETIIPSAGLKDRLVAMLHSMIGQVDPSIDAPHIADWLRARLTVPSFTDLPPSQTPAAAEDRLMALETLDSLREPAGADLCHGDANPGNILVGKQDRLWWVDPRGVRGEVAYDVAVSALKAATVLGTEPLNLAASLASEIGVCPTRTCAWVTVAQAARV